MNFKDITPAAFACHSKDCCPAVLETETSYVIIGKKLSADALKAAGVMSVKFMVVFLLVGG